MAPSRPSPPPFAAALACALSALTSPSCSRGEARPEALVGASPSTRDAPPVATPPPASAATVDALSTTSANGAAPTPPANGAPATNPSSSAPPTNPSGSAASASPAGSARAVDGCPPDMARVGKACVDRWEARLWSTDASGTASPHPHNERPEAGVAYHARSEPGVFPQGYVSRVEAASACKAAGKRLCRMAEWRRACQGKRWATFPYGGRFERGRCNVSKDHLLTKFFGANGRAWRYDESFNNPKLLAEPGFLAKSGEYEGCVGDAGVHDLVGNLHEWVADTVDDDLVDRMQAEPYERKKQPWRTGNGVFLGGFFSTTKEHGPGCAFITIAHEPTYHDYSIGFRCCRDAS